MENVLVFRTSVRKKMEIKKLRPLLNQIIGTERNWNFDLEDCDNILRVQTQNSRAEYISSVLRNNGYSCEEL